MVKDRYHWINGALVHQPNNTRAEDSIVRPPNGSLKIVLWADGLYSFPSTYSYNTKLDAWEEVTFRSIPKEFKLALLLLGITYD